MNEFSNDHFGDFLPENFGEDPSVVVQRVSVAAPYIDNSTLDNSYVAEEAEYGAGPTRTATEAPVVQRYADISSAASPVNREREAFLAAYAGLSGLALTNGSTNPIFWSDSKYDYQYYPTTGATLWRYRGKGDMAAATTTTTIDYIRTEGQKKVAARDKDAASSSGAASAAPAASTPDAAKTKGLSVAGGTALGAGIGAGLGELATRMAALLGPQTSIPLSAAELSAGGAPPPSGSSDPGASGTPWGLILGGTAALAVVGGIVFIATRKKSKED